MTSKSKINKSNQLSLDMEKPIVLSQKKNTSTRMTQEVPVEIPPILNRSTNMKYGMPDRNISEKIEDQKTEVIPEKVPVPDDDDDEDELPMITPTLAMFYQITNSKKPPFKDITGDIIDIYYRSVRKMKLSYEEAIEATKDTESEIWDTKIYPLTYNLYADLMFLYRFFSARGAFSKQEPVIDIDFLIDIFKREALERQKGNITFVHARNGMFKIMNSVLSLITNQDTLFVQKCVLKQKSPKKAREKYKEIYDALPDYDSNSNNYTPDHIKFIRERLISTNLSLLNNIFNIGESSFFWFIDAQGSMGNIRMFLSDKIKNESLLIKLGNLVSEIYFSRSELRNIGHTIMMISIPQDKLDEYVFSSNYGGRINIKYKDLNQYLKKYLGKRLWGNDFATIYSTQFRIMDLCYYKYGKNDGIEIFEFEQESIDPVDIEFTIRQKFTPKEIQELSVITDLPSEIKEFTQWPQTYRQPENKVPKDLVSVPGITSPMIRNGSIMPLTPRNPPNPRSPVRAQPQALGSQIDIEMEEKKPKKKMTNSIEEDRITKSIKTTMGTPKRSPRKKSTQSKIME
jgi:hypothetical protein